MNKVTNKSLKDSDIDIEKIKERLVKIADEININNKHNLTDINVICEDIFGQILNRLYAINLLSLSAEVSGDFIAVDLVDYENRIAYQVTSRYDRKKIDGTLKKFMESDLISNIDKLNFLVLNVTNHSYRGADVVRLKNGQEFSYSKNIMNFNRFVEEIDKKNEAEPGFVIEVYDIISMVYDSGRLRYVDIVKETERLMRTGWYGSDDLVSWVKGYGDIHLSAMIPLSYEKELCCMLQIRQHNISGAYITLGQDALLNDYFLTETEFEKKHNVGRYENEEKIYMQVENIRFNINAHTAYHVYKLFQELKEEYYAAIRRINAILGTEGLRKIGQKYLLMTIDAIEWEKILFFAGKHDWFREDGEMEWNIFNNNSSNNSLTLSPNVYGTIKGDILAKIWVQESKEEINRLDLYWEPGYVISKGCMDCFDNVVKWKADYTRDWIKNKLLKKASIFWNEYYSKTPLWASLLKWRKG